VDGWMEFLWHKLSTSFNKDKCTKREEIENAPKIIRNKRRKERRH
jgi:hypothetical protein